MDINKILKDYFSKFEGEKESQSELLEFVSKYNTYEEQTSSNNFGGHITSSSIIVSRRSKKMLKLFNHNLKMDLQPGGHIPDSISPVENAKRILTGLGITDVVFVPDINNELIPLDIDTHTILKNEKKSEPEHLHHDFRYLFVCEDEFRLSDETHKWEEIPALKKYNTYINLIDKVQFLWSKEYTEKQFYSSIVQNITRTKNITFIVVQHFLPGIDHFLRSLESIGNIGLVIPKPKSIVPSINEKLEKIYPVLHTTRNELLDHNEFQSALANNENIVFIDIGGWFATILLDVSKSYEGKIIGVVEDTENGHQKYESLGEITVPIISVARSPLKLNEDTLIGISIVFSADSILRTQNKLIRYMNCGVLGYGKVGKSIAQELIRKSLKPIVYDIDTLKMIEAYNDGCFIDINSNILKNCDAIFCATGNESIVTNDLNDIKSGAYIFSVTSADDEFDFSNIDNQYKKEKISEHVERYYLFDSSFFIVNKGNAVNFIHNAVVGDFIHLVKAEMLMALNEIFSSNERNEIFEVSAESREVISKLWLKHFQNLSY